MLPQAPDQMVQSDQCGDRSQTAILLLKRAALPDIPEQDIVGQTHELWGEIAKGTFGHGRM
jgi:hypothetical protein